MTYRTIPIQPAASSTSLPVVEPRLAGERGRVLGLLEELERAVCAELGARVPAGAWLREFSLDDGKAVVSLAPGLDRRGPEIAQAAFDTLRRLLHDTDIYVGAAGY